MDASPIAAEGKTRARGGLAETTRFLLILFVFTVLLRTLVAAPFSIPSGSMLPRMMIGDYLFVAKWPYGYSRYSVPFGLARFEGRFLERLPARGDIVVFHYPGRGDMDYVKRVIGLPGDTVQMRNGLLVLNGRAVPRTRIADFVIKVTPNSPCRRLSGAVARQDEGAATCAYPRYRETLPDGRSYEIIDQTAGPGDDTELFVVPARHYFVMGDNRDDSEDSRYPVEIGGIGFLPADNLVGRALVTFFSTDGSAQLAHPSTWLKSVRWQRIGETY
jgi:signal peptidase I